MNFFNKDFFCFIFHIAFEKKEVLMERVYKSMKNKMERKYSYSCKVESYVVFKMQDIEEFVK